MQTKNGRWYDYFTVNHLILNVVVFRYTGNNNYYMYITFSSMDRHTQIWVRYWIINKFNLHL